MTAMKFLIANLGANLAALLCIGTAGYLAANDKGGWGWFLLVGLLCAGSVAWKEKCDE